MQYSSSYKKRPPQRRMKKRRKLPKNFGIWAFAAILLAAILLVGGVLLHKHLEEKRQVSEFEPIVSTTQAPQTEPQTEAESETATAENGEAVKPMSMTLYSTVTTLNVRAKPSTDGEKLGMVGKDEPLKVTGRCANGWYEIEYKNGKGYVSGEYVTEAAGETQRSESPYLYKVNTTQNIVIAYSKDANGDYTVAERAMVCSVGIDGKTPLGTFSTPGSKYEWRLLSGNVYGQYATRINGPYLFHSVPYFTKDKSDLEYEEYNKLGSPASKGCIRLSVEDAKWVYEHCPKGTTVQIYASDEKEPLKKPTPQKIDVSDTAKRGWDPTDPDKANPWHA